MPEQNKPRGTPTMFVKLHGRRRELQSLRENALESFKRPARGFLGWCSQEKA